ncbi:MAG: pyridoxamine 5'-phosphate oxidase family protein [Desulfomicrobium sp.]|uniref:MSMEG_1061 family FMN-dependent PPOX-type flavoprotein n=1 Tax=Hoeflea sp. TaxID=1940281 RepID=UPI0025BDB29E|nr:MSMEG_1061 family FMN-dependent PPOX-type flavoprotein [Hoeflea sp.]MBU4529389.1 pyridoxamine 5'-phosphate oxidase family protein [Alphaproteobacteria bacterium]MBV1712639.1 pyridoxamine 5'-phosphate oxidase family protein [Desulfomicrobium sp.]MBU4544800.1 pyridoxamine 5'-phosphate oxidase family protein [Alphaproteobacteria bacterium]MBU4548822.1 pyridoxamine 5'-phosphate oxidase family protein [Alphaproteobacteria bacterium]MBV1785045.1 pyridoxamine 5'-phosphate oxidase family protein [H
MALIVSDPVDTVAKLRAILPRWNGNASRKDHDRVNDVAASFIARSPYVIISSATHDGGHDVSPKGDEPGFVTVQDDKTLIIPDLGNHRLDTFENLLVDPRVGLLFLIPGHTETLRIAGTGQIARDEVLRAPFVMNGRLPELVLVVTVKQVFMHCSKSLVRSKLWSPKSWTHADDAPSLAQWVKSTVDTAETLEQVQGIHDRDRENRLY